MVQVVKITSQLGIASYWSWTSVSTSCETDGSPSYLTACLAPGGFLRGQILLAQLAPCLSAGPWPWAPLALVPSAPPASSSQPPQRCPACRALAPPAPPAPAPAASVLPWARWVWPRLWRSLRVRAAWCGQRSPANRHQGGSRRLIPGGRIHPGLCHRCECPWWTLAVGRRLMSCPSCCRIESSSWAVRWKMRWRRCWSHRCCTWPTRTPTRTLPCTSTRLVDLFLPVWQLCCTFCVILSYFVVARPCFKMIQNV